MQNKISIFTIIGFSLSLLSILVCNWYYIAIIFVVVPAIVFCFIGRNKGEKANKTLATIGIVVGIIMFLFTIWAPRFIRAVDRAKEQAAIEQEVR